MTYSKSHLPTHEEIIKNLSYSTADVHIEVLPDTVRERVKRNLEISKLEREARMFDVYSTKKEDYK